MKINPVNLPLTGSKTYFARTNWVTHSRLHMTRVYRWHLKAGHTCGWGYKVLGDPLKVRHNQSELGDPLKWDTSRAYWGPHRLDLLVNGQGVSSGTLQTVSVGGPYHVVQDPHDMLDAGRFATRVPRLAFQLFNQVRCFTHLA